MVTVDSHKLVNYYAPPTATVYDIEAPTQSIFNYANRLPAKKLRSLIECLEFLQNNKSQECIKDILQKLNILNITKKSQIEMLLNSDSYSRVSCDLIKSLWDLHLEKLKNPTRLSRVKWNLKLVLTKLKV